MGTTQNAIEPRVAVLVDCDNTVLKYWIMR